MTAHSSPRRCLPPASGVGRCDLGTSHAPAVALSGPTTAPPVEVGPDTNRGRTS